jgi:hypothetical protein
MDIIWYDFLFGELCCTLVLSVTFLETIDTNRSGKRYDRVQVGLFLLVRKHL